MFTPLSISPKALSADGTTLVGWNYVTWGWTPYTWTLVGGLVQEPEDLWGDASDVSGVSGDGALIVGQFDEHQYDWGYKNAMIWPVGGAVTLIPGQSACMRPCDTSAHDISADGLTVVGRTMDYDGSNEAFRWTASGGIQPLGDLRGGIPDPNNPSPPFMLYSSTASSVSGDGSVILGSSRNASNNWVQYRWTASGGMQELGFGASELSNDGNVIVGSDGGHAVLWTELGGLQTLSGIPAGFSASGATDVSVDGGVIAGWADTASGREVFLWDNEQGIKKLDQLLTNHGIDVTGWTFESVIGISDDGTTLAGKGTNPQGSTQYWIATVPEPKDWIAAVPVFSGGGWALLCIAMASTAMLRLARSRVK
jgi:hypothetical protein